MSGASTIQHRVTFSIREEYDDGYGNTVGQWVPVATLFAEFKHLRGSETVLANRLSGSHIQVMRIRASTTSQRISTDWKATCRGVDFNIRDVTPTEDRAWIDVLAEAGVAV